MDNFFKNAVKTAIRNQALLTVVISLIVAQLAATVKNPQSDRSQGLILAVEQLHGATHQFLTQVTGKEPA